MLQGDDFPLSFHYNYYYIITFMQGIYNYVPETNHVSHAECYVPLPQHFMQHCAVHNMAVVWQFLNLVLSRYVAQVLSE